MIKNFTKYFTFDYAMMLMLVLFYPVTIALHVIDAKHEQGRKHAYEQCINSVTIDNLEWVLDGGCKNSAQVVESKLG